MYLLLIGIGLVGTVLALNRVHLKKIIFYIYIKIHVYVVNRL